MTASILITSTKTDKKKDKHQEHIDYLFDIAKTIPPLAGARVAASIVYKNDIVTIGMNSSKTHTFQFRFSSNPDAIFFHAENNAIYKALRILTPKELEKSVLYVCRAKYTDKNKKTFMQGLAKPCCGCTEAIIKYNISSVIYSLDNYGYEWL